MSDVFSGKMTRVETGCGTLTIHMNNDESVYADIKKCGGCATSQAEANSRLIALCLRHNVPEEDIIDQLKGIRCSSPSLEALSCADALAKGMERILEKEGGS